MDVDQFLKLGQMSIETAVVISAPVLIAGLAVSIFQAATQINDAALAFIPKIGAAVIALLFFGHFILNKMATFTIWIYTQIPHLTNLG